MSKRTHGKEPAANPSGTMWSTRSAGSGLPFAGTLSPEEMQYYAHLAQRYYLSLELVMAAKEIFDRYRALDAPANVGGLEENSSFAEEMSGASEGRTGGLGGTYASLSASYRGGRGGPAGAAGGEKKTDSRHSTIAVIEDEAIGVAGLQALYLGLGIVKSGLEIADLIQTMSAPPAEMELLRRKEAAEAMKLAAEANPPPVPPPTKRAAKHKAPGPTTPRPSSSIVGTGSGGVMLQLHPEQDVDLHSNPPLPSPTASAQSSHPRGLSFPLFIYLLQQRLSEEEERLDRKDAELAEVFRILDSDGDGVLSVADISDTLSYLMDEEQVLAGDLGMIELASMHPVALQAALGECDMDADGIVTLQDLLAVLRV